MAKPNPLPPVEVINQLLNFDANSGTFSWKVTRQGHAKPGMSAGTLTDDGYLEIMVARRRCRAHRLVWKLMTGRDPVNFIDHIDGNRLNNRFSNLREATNSENNFNSKARADNTSGHRGVFYYKRLGKYQVQFNVCGKVRHFGYFATKEEAIDAAKKAIAELHGEFAFSKENA